MIEQISHHVFVNKFNKVGPLRFSEQVSIPFTPHHAIVRLISIASNIDTYTGEVYLLHCPTISTTLGAVNIAADVVPGTMIDLNGKQVNTQWQIEVIDTSGDLVSLKDDGDEITIAVQIEFVRYK